MDLRRPLPDEARTLQAFVQAAFEGYYDLAPPGWEPPDETRPEQIEKVAAALADPACWACVAFDGDLLVGYTLWQPVDDLAHVRAVFVAPSHWGTGLGARLLRDGTAAMGGRGWSTGRLFTPARHARARRFYEREGWSTAGPEHFEPRIGFDMVEYRRALR